ncbi:hypothetical protein BDW42DRAFT_75000 [Aspergillus taichungensis]|uniref:DUF1295 domain protein n=1 Tax=Aspergillus taichungensis TaxID=482145 RepID=A0A2J5HZK5_9EURO|nr:hypothetical protein BDW42DRAFT_75000 [Aspergillus taichungensis]
MEIYSTSPTPLGELSHSLQEYSQTGRESRATPSRRDITGTGRPSTASSSNLSDIGLVKSTILPSFTLNSAISVATYVAARTANRADLKDCAWPATQVLNAWWAALGQPIFAQRHNITRASPSLGTTWRALPWSQKVLLGCVTAWGSRLLYHIAARSVDRGHDDARYEEMKKQDPGFWDTALWKVFLPEAAALTIISLPFTVPFRLPGQGVLDLSRCCGGVDVAGVARTLGVAVFGVGFALETLADLQLGLYKHKRGDLCREGVWSVVRHPNYLGDALVHASFALLNIANGLNPVVLLGPVANYLFLRLFGGDKENETGQEERYTKYDKQKYEQLQAWRQEKNRFWPALSEISNPWSWVVLGCGVASVVVEESVRGWIMS